MGASVTNTIVLQQRKQPQTEKNDRVQNTNEQVLISFDYVYHGKTHFVGLAKARQILVLSNLDPDERKAYDDYLDIRNSELAIAYSKAEEEKNEEKEEGRIECEKLVREHEILPAEIARLKQTKIIFVIIGFQC
ncbi:MAG: hypothetical protein LBI18_07700 [Planctomycetaceae bacterium]|nr:hypothetical protein [Planctomycetaceae bacterium]